MTEEKQENLDDPFSEWEAESKGKGDYFSPILGVQYKVVLKECVFKKKIFKKDQPEKWAMVISFVTIDGQPTEKTWSSSSATIIKALKPFYKKQNQLQSILWLLKKGGDQNKTTYIFENIGEVRGSTPSNSPNEVPFA